jgi:hypothetical protein
MKRTPITLATLVAGSILALASGIASASNGYTFDEPYWKQALERTSVESAATASRLPAEPMGKYAQVDRYNP